VALRLDLTDEPCYECALDGSHLLESRQIDLGLGAAGDHADDVSEDRLRAYLVRVTEVAEPLHGDRPLTPLVSGDRGCLEPTFGEGGDLPECEPAFRASSPQSLPNLVGEIAQSVPLVEKRHRTKKAMRHGV